MMIGQVKDLCKQYKRELMVGGVVFTGVFLVFRKLRSRKIEEKENGVKVVDGDVLNYTLGFAKPNVEEIRFRGMPDGFNWRSLKALYSLIFEIVLRSESKKIDILNARTRDLKLEQCGFTMIPFEEDFDMKDWKTKEAQEKFKKQVEPILLKLFPGAEVKQWTGFLFRGQEEDNPPAVDGPHIDAYPDWKMAEKFNKWDREAYEGKLEENDENIYEWITSGQRSKDDCIYIGLWKPINMNNPVYDFPLALMDTSTFDLEKSLIFSKQEMSHIYNGAKMSFKNLGGFQRYDEKQKWYYYPKMTTKEMVIFTHVGRHCKTAGPHTAIRDPTAPKDKSSFDSRNSMEVRLYLTYPKKSSEE